MSLADLKPLDDRILVKKIPLPESDGIRVVTALKDAGEWAHWKASQQKAIVVRCGPGRRFREGEKNMHRLIFADGRRRPMCVKPGDVIYYGRFTDAEGSWRTEDEEYAVIQEGDVIAIEVQDGDGSTAA